jgi:hypothetical protein
MTQMLVPASDSINNLERSLKEGNNRNEGFDFAPPAQGCRREG